MKAQLIELGGTDPHKRLTWYCPGCQCNHGVPVPPHSQAWEWNGSLETPTLSPSVLVHASKAYPDWQPRCHCFIRNGQIEFCGDSAHELAGKTVPLPEMN